MSRIRISMRTASGRSPRRCCAPRRNKITVVTITQRAGAAAERRQDHDPSSGLGAGIRQPRRDHSGALPAASRRTSRVGRVIRRPHHRLHKETIRHEVRHGQQENRGSHRCYRRHLVRFAAAIDEIADHRRRADHGRDADGLWRLGQYGADRRRCGRVGRVRRYRAEQDRPASRGRRDPRDLCARRRHRGGRPGVARSRRHRGTGRAATAVPAPHQADGHRCKAAGRDEGGAGNDVPGGNRQLAGEFARPVRPR